jgi:hypothetical protein
MSRIYKTSSEDQRRLEKFNETFALVLQRAKEHYLYDSDSDSNSDDSSNGRPNPYLPQLNVLYEIGERLEARQRVVLEDITINFGVVKTIDDFSEYECYNYFRFLKQDLVVVANALWPRLSPYLESDNPERINVGNRYIAHYETCLCAFLYKMLFPQRVRGHAEQFFCIRKSKLSVMIRFFW